ncbi:hypothetical protein FACS189468_2190 [Spirochaetia bacterium]|nr:hypothetical protein FACS189468_2190 [Spirochaetia bacterium]
MSRSHKKTAAGGHATSSSEKFDKRTWHKKMRNLELQKLNPQNNVEEQILPVVKEVSDPWLMSKDGKGLHFLKTDLRKDIDAYIRSRQNGVYQLVSPNCSVNVKKYFFDCFRTDDIQEIFSLTDEQKEKLIGYITRQWTRK